MRHYVKDFYRMLLPTGCIDYKKGNDIKYFIEGDHLAILSIK
jgi:hypothetical protein